MALFAHSLAQYVVLDDCAELSCLLLGGLEHIVGLALISRGELSLDLALQVCALVANILVEKEQEEMWVKEGSQFLNLG